MKACIQEAICTYFDYGVTSDSAKYHVAEGYKRLMLRRAQAEADHALWITNLALLRGMLKHHDVRDTTHFNTANCYQCHVMLCSDLDFNPDDCYGNTKGLKVGYIAVYCSVLCDVATTVIEQVTYPQGELEPSFSRVEWESDFRHTVNLVWSWLSELGYVYIDRSEYQELVEGISLEYTEDGSATVFDCLFDEFVSSDLR